MKIAVIGKGGREHALVKALKESPSAPEMYCFPGSDAINRLATPIPARDLPSLIDWMVSNKMDLCVAGEESYLVKDEGLANACTRAGIPCWGPVKESARLEASKEFAKDFLLRHRIPTGQARVAATLEEARQFIGNNYPTVLKFDGLAAGKGVAVCMSKEEADSFLKEVFTDRRFGEGRLLVEEFLTGPEVSIFGALVDDHYLILCPARDYKRLKEGDAGPNTGGMGAVASRRLVEPEMLERIEKEIVAPTVAGLKKDGLPYRGFLYFGLMLTPNGPKVIEYNCRFGDPECQAVMPLLSGDLASFCLHGAKGEFAPEEISFKTAGASAACWPPKDIRRPPIPATLFRDWTIFQMLPFTTPAPNGMRIKTVMKPMAAASWPSWHRGIPSPKRASAPTTKSKRFNLTACSADRTSALPASSD